MITSRSSILYEYLLHDTRHPLYANERVSSDITGTNQLPIIAFDLGDDDALFPISYPIPIVSAVGIDVDKTRLPAFPLGPDRHFVRNTDGSTSYNPTIGREFLSTRSLKSSFIRAMHGYYETFRIDDKYFYVHKGGIYTSNFEPIFLLCLTIGDIKKLLSTSQPALNGAFGDSNVTTSAATVRFLEDIISKLYVKVLSDYDTNTEKIPISLKNWINRTINALKSQPQTEVVVVMETELLPDVIKVPLGEMNRRLDVILTEKGLPLIDVQTQAAVMADTIIDSYEQLTPEKLRELYSPDRRSSLFAQNMGGNHSSLLDRALATTYTRFYPTSEPIFGVSDDSGQDA